MSAATGAKRRWWIAHQINRLPGTCWADLVTWVLGWHQLRGHVRVTPACIRDAERNCACYCGKVRCAS